MPMVGDVPVSRWAGTHSSANRLRTDVPDEAYFRSTKGERPLWGVPGFEFA